MATGGTYTVNNAADEIRGLSGDEEASNKPARTTTMDSPIRKQNSNGFYGVFGAAQILGIVSIILVIVWITKYLGGFGWENPGVRFNYHPLFMILGFIFLGGNALLVYRLLRNEPKPMLKNLHAAINGLGFIFAIVGAVAVFSFHNNAKPNPIPNLYSIHSWVGLLVLILFGSQFVGGLVVFLFPGAPGAIRAMIMPFHVYGGSAIFGLSVVAVISGINEKAFFSMDGKPGKLPSYSTLPSAGVVCNLLGLSVIGFALLVGFLVTSPEYKRQPLPEEQTISMQMEETQN